MLIGLGWDVGGWQGNNQRFAVAVWDCTNIEWPTKPFSTKLSELGNDPAALDKLWPRLIGRQIQPTDTVVIGIDAPLGWPVAFKDLPCGPAQFPGLPNRQIKNRFAYRETERYIHRHYNKIALSAPFDKLGNNATVAVAYAQEWVRQGYHLLPQQGQVLTRRTIIEVYPALEKSRNPIGNDIVKNALVHVPPAPYDAEICALLALSMADQESKTGLPRLVSPVGDATVLQQEGWIYHWA